jgi:hypothetical protein
MPQQRTHTFMPLVAPPATPDPELAALRAKSALQRKKTKTPLEDRLAAGDGSRAVRLVQWARTQKQAYDASLITWRANRIKWAQEAQDIFDHRAAARKEQEDEDPSSVFEVANESINIVASLAEFAAAQAEQDIYGGDPWFAAIPVGRSDPDLAEQVQKHLQWSFRDGRMVDTHCQGIDQAVTLGECYHKTLYCIDTDESESVVPCLHVNGKPVTDQNGQYVTTDEQAATLGPLKGKKEWKDAFTKQQTVIRQGVEVLPIHFNDISFREDAPELDLRYTSVYISVEMSVFEAMRRFKLSKEDAIKLAQVAGAKVAAQEHQQEKRNDTTATTTFTETEELGEEEAEKLLNTRVRLIEGYIRADATGTGQEVRMCIVFPPTGEDWIIWADYLANISPKAELPVKCEVWEPVPHRSYGRGFFAKYAYLQTGTDNLWNQVSFRNAMHANPIVGLHLDKMDRDEDTEEFVLKPNVSVHLKGDNKLADAIETFSLPDADSRSMELMQIGMQLAQLRSGITSASQGDMSGIPESNTATGIRSLMSRAAVLLKKPIRRMRRAKGRAFSYAVKLHYSNFDREEAFVWGEGRNQQLITITPKQVNDLDIDVRMLLTQEQNQTKLEGAQVASGLIAQWLAVPEAEKPAVRPLFLQAIKALDFDQADEIVRQAVAQIEDCISLLSPEQAQRLQGLLALEQNLPQTPAPPQTTPQ